ncbi:MAG: hypothetical protein J1F66_02560 [Clostridiales bacterium]|nr:hypothetical protein [Clostridiales bacterium]
MTKIDFKKVNSKRLIIVILSILLLVSLSVAVFAQSGNDVAYAATIQDIVVGGNIGVENDTSYPWTSASDDGSTWTFNSGSGKSGSKTSNLKITINEERNTNAYIYFEFTLSTDSSSWGSSYGSWAYAMYNFDSNVVGSGKSGATTGKDIAYSANGGATTLKLSDTSTAAATDLGNGWYGVTLTVSASVKCVYVAVATTLNGGSLTPNFSASMSIREMKYFTGETAQISYKLINSAGGTVTASGADFDNNNTAAVNLNTKINFEVTSITDGYTFFGWTDENGKILSTAQKFTYTVSSSDAITIVANVDKGGAYIVARGNSYLYTATNFATNIQRTPSGETVQFVANATISGEVIIPSGVTLNLPYNDSGDVINHKSGGQLTTAFPWSTSAYEQQYRYMTVTFNGTLTVAGTLQVGGITNAAGSTIYQGHTSGAYSHLIVNGAVTISGAMNVCGRVTGSGGITVQSGGQLSQPFVVYDYAGGSNTKSLYDDGQAPFGNFAMVNIQCSGGYTINPGGKLVGYCQLYAASQYNTTEAILIADSKTTSLFQLADGASVHVKYDNTASKVATAGNKLGQYIGKTTMVFNGGATMSAMSLKINFSILSQTVETSKVYFPMPYNYDIQLNGNNAQYKITNYLKVLPGATLTVGNGATLTVGKGLHVYDGFVPKGFSNAGTTYYPTAAQLTAAKYSTCGNLIVNGKLAVPSGATFLGAVQATEVDATIEIASGATVGDTTVKTGSSDAGNYVDFTISARVWDEAHKVLAKLSAGTYTSVNGKNVTWTLPSMAMSTGNTTAVTTMKGSWKVEHSENDKDFDWTLKDGEAPTANNTVVSVTRQCSQLGCTETRTRNLLYVPEQLTGVYLGRKYETEGDIRPLFEKMFRSGINATITPNKDIKDAGVIDYKVTIALTDADCYWYSGGDANKQYVKSLDIKFTVTPAPLGEANVQAIGSQTYNGSAIQPEPVVKFNSTTLEKDKDYTLTYGANINAGQGTVTVNGMGNFEGSVKITFTIDAKDISGGNLTIVTSEAGYVYTGSAIEAEFTFTLEGFGSNVTYEKQWTNNVNAGTATLKLKGTGNFTGETEAKEFTIKPRSLDGATVTVGGSYTYSGQSHKPSKNAIEVTVRVSSSINLTLRQEDLADDKFTISYGENINAGDGAGSVTVAAKQGGNFTGSATGRFAIAKAKLSADNVEIEDRTYTGSKITPTPTVTFNGAELQNERDYTLAYGNNTTVEEGGKITVIGMGNFTADELVVTFKILAKDIEEDGEPVISGDGEDEFVYTGDDEFKPEYILQLSGFRVVADTDYTVGYYRESEFSSYARISYDDKPQTTDFTSAGTIIVVISGKGNFTGTVTTSYTINPATISAQNVETFDTPIYTGRDIEPIVIKFNGKLLEKDKDYTIVYENNKNVTASAKASVTGIRNFDGEFNITFAIQPKDIGDGELTISGSQTDYVFNNSEIEAVYTFTLEGFTDNSIEVNYTESYRNNVKAGTATLTLKGSGNFTGTKSANFTINVKDMSEATATVMSEHVYNGKSQTPTVQIALDGFVYQYEVGADYRLVFAEGQDLTSAATSIPFTIQFEGNFSGQIDASFDIQQKSIDGATVTIESGNFEYQNKDLMPSVTSVTTADGLLTLTAGDYTVSYINNKNASTATSKATVTVTAKEGGNYIGSASTTFEIKQSELVITPQPATSAEGDEQAPLTAEVSGWHENEDIWTKIELKLFDKDGKEITDVTKLKAEDRPVITIKVVYKDGFVPSANYVVTLNEASYVITDSVFANVKFEGHTVTYDGNSHALAATGYPEGAQLRYTVDGEDFSGAVNQGTYEVTVTITLDGHNPIALTAFLIINKRNIEVEVFGQSQKYSGSVHEVSNGARYYSIPNAVAEDLAQGRLSVTLSGSRKDVGSVAIGRELSGVAKDNYNVTKWTDASFTITVASIDTAIAKVVDGSYVYNAKPHTPEFNVVWNGITLVHKTDYTLEYSNNTEAGTANVTVKGIGNFAGSELAAEFAISAAPISSVAVTSSHVYNGKTQLPSLVVNSGDIVLNDGEYSVTYEGDLTLAGTVTVKVASNSANFTGNATTTFTIEQAPLSASNVRAIDAQTYTGSAIKPEVVVTFNGETLTKGSDYTLTYGNGTVNNTTVKEGGIVIVKGMGNFKGEFDVTFAINPKKISDGKIIITGNYVYSGNDIEASYTFELDGYTLTESDYTVRWSNNRDAGTATLRLTGTGNFIGTKSENFTIDKATVTNVTVSGSYTYNERAKTPNISAIVSEALKLSDTDYSVTYYRDGQKTEDLTSAGVVTVEITAFGNFKGTVSTTFTIAQATIDSVVVNDLYTYNGSAQEFRLSIKAGSLILNEGDYEVSYDRDGDITSAGNVTVTVIGVGNFKGSVSTTVRIAAKEVTVELHDQPATYNGQTQYASSDNKWWDVNGLVQGEERDVLGLEINGSGKDVGSYKITATISNNNYALNLTGANLVISPKTIKVKVLGQTAAYQNRALELEQSKWEFVGGGFYDGDEVTVTLRKEAGINVGKYDITAEVSGADATNYTVEFDLADAQFEITKATIAVTVGDLTSVYGDGIEDLKHAVAYSGLLGTDENRIDVWSHIEVATDRDVRDAGSYTITVQQTDDLDNYVIEVLNSGTYTVTARPVNVTINNQTAVYNRDNSYYFNANGWTLNGTIVKGDSLGVTISTTEALTVVGEYEITGDWTNKNYKITFVNGTYTITKLDISDEAVFVLIIGGNQFVDGTKVIYEGEALTVVGRAILSQGGLPITLTLLTDPAEINAVGTYTVKLTIEDPNYAGEREYTVTVARANGYSDNLQSTLDELDELAGDMTREDLTPNDFGKIKDIFDALESLTDEEREMAADELEHYQDLVDAWNDVCNVDDVITTAKKVADAPIGGLYVTVSTLSALLALAYVALKGGILK